ncbi:hypothetical protein AAFF_G00428160 [Aldrovandia affinis]|uniref:Uncharacterized protein n=1 Tax=Aldrovandia affinis TaxID=143900 RepID=A0AAD7WIG8_9TELE|nr:hypothetical protein AAFF_G00428160 [Aldrovandia affinis]
MARVRDVMVRTHPALARSDLRAARETELSRLPFPALSSDVMLQVKICGQRQSSQAPLWKLPSCLCVSHTASSDLMLHTHWVAGAVCVSRSEPDDIILFCFREQER